MNLLIFTTQYRISTPLEKKAFEYIVEKGDNAGIYYFVVCKCFEIGPVYNSVVW